MNFTSCIRKRKWDERTDDSGFSSCVLRSCPYPPVDPRVFIIPFKLPALKTCLWESLACLNCTLTQLTKGPYAVTLQYNFAHHDIQLPQQTLSEAEWAFISAKHVFRQSSSEGRNYQIELVSCTSICTLFCIKGTKAYWQVSVVLPLSLWLKWNYCLIAVHVKWVSCHWTGQRCHILITCYVCDLQLRDIRKKLAAVSSSLRRKYVLETAIWEFLWVEDDQLSDNNINISNISPAFKLWH